MKLEDKGMYKIKRFVTWWLLFLFLIVPMASITDAQVIKNTVEYKPGCGHLRGFIFKPDGKTPLWGAQVVLQHVETRQVFRSNVTDSTGDYLVLDIPAGNYVVLILTRDKIYNVKSVDFFIKIIAGKTSTISFSLKKSLSGLFLFLLDPCCVAAVIPIIPDPKKPKEPEQSPTQR